MGEQVGALASLMALFGDNQVAAIAIFGWLLTVLALIGVSAGWYLAERRHDQAYKRIGERHDKEREEYVEALRETNKSLQSVRDLIVGMNAVLNTMK